MSLGVETEGRELNRLSGALFEQARRSVYVAVATSAIVLGLQLVYSVSVPIRGSDPPATVSNIYITISLLGILISQAFLFRGETKQSLAHEARRLDLWEVTLGHSIEDYLKREVQRNAGNKAQAAALKRPASEDIQKFELPPGARLLLSVVCHRGEMTAVLYRWFGGRLLWSLTLLGGLTALTLYVFLLIAPPVTVTHVAARAVAVIVAGSLTVQVLNWGLRLRRLANGVDGVFKSARALLKAGEVSIDQAVVLAGEYNLLISRGVFIPQWVYEHLRDQVPGHERTVGK